MDPYERFRHDERNLQPATLTSHRREQIFYDVETPFVKGKLAAIIRKLKKEFFISFDVKPHSFATEWSNLIHFTIGSNIGNAGDRVPGVWFHESGNGRLFIVAPINGDPNYSFETNPLALNQWTNVEISQLKEGDSYLYTVKLNGETVILQENAVAESFKNVKVYTSDPWHSAPDGLIKNFHIINGHLHKSSSKATILHREQIVHNFETPLVQGKLVAVIPKLDKEFLLSFDVKPNSFSPEWANVIHLTVGSNIGELGDRVPGVWFHESGDGRLYIAAPLNDDPNYSFNTNSLALNQWTNVEISQQQVEDVYLYTIKLNGETVFNEHNHHAKTFKNVKVYTSDPWHNAQNGSIKDFYIINRQCRNSSSLSAAILRREQIIQGSVPLVKGKLEAIIPKLDKQFILSFDVKPLSFATKWTNVIHLTTGSNIGSLSDRIPGVWFHESGNGSLYIATPLNGDTNHSLGTSPLPLKHWSNVEISQLHAEGVYVYSVKLNGEQIFSEPNHQPESFENVKVYVSDPWHSAHNGLIRNFHIINGQLRNSPATNAAILLREQILDNIERPIVQGEVVAVIPKLDKEFLFSFDVKPNSFVTEWANLIHFTTGSNIGNIGDRVPGIWFHEWGNGQLYIETPINGRSSFETKPLALYQWTNVEVSQQLESGVYTYSVKVNGEKVFSQQNYQAESFEKVKIYASDPWHKAQDGFIKNLFVLNGHHASRYHRIQLL